MSLLQRALSPIVEVRKEEIVGVVLMFAYSFLAMAAYNALKPVTRSTFIADFGADNLPYVLLVAGLLIGVLMTGYTWVVSRLPGKAALAITQIGMVGVLIGFWFLFQTGAAWVSAAFYLMGLILGILLISQFWTVANLVYDARQAKRLFGFVGAGAPLGGMAGSFITQTLTDDIGTTNLLLVSSGMLLLSAFIVWTILRRSQVDPSAAVPDVEQEKGVGFTEALALQRGTNQNKIIAVVMSFP